jgi:hypothetical protein
LELLQFEASKVTANQEELTQEMVDSDYEKAARAFNNADQGKEGYAFIFGMITNKHFSPQSEPLYQANLEHILVPPFAIIAQLGCK